MHACAQRNHFLLQTTAVIPRLGRAACAPRLFQQPYSPSSPSDRARALCIRSPILAAGHHLRAPALYGEVEGIMLGVLTTTRVQQ